MANNLVMFVLMSSPFTITSLLRRVNLRDEVVDGEESVVDEVRYGKRVSRNLNKGWSGLLCIATLPTSAPERIPTYSSSQTSEASPQSFVFSFSTRLSKLPTLSIFCWLT